MGRPLLLMTFAIALLGGGCTDLGPVGNQIRSRLLDHLSSATVAFGSELGPPSEVPRIGERFDVEVDLEDSPSQLVFAPDDLDLSSCGDSGDDPGGDEPTDGLPTELPTDITTDVPTTVDSEVVVPLDTPRFAWSSHGTLIDTVDETSPVGTFGVSASPTAPGRTPPSHSVGVEVTIVAHPERVPVLAACGLVRPIVVTRRLDLAVPSVPLELPGTLVLFVDDHYEGSILVFVPEGTPDALSERESLLRHYLNLERLLNDAQDDVVGLKGDLKFLSIIGPLGIVTDALDDNVVFRRQDEEVDLNDIRMKDRFDFDSGVLDVEAEDEMSSVAFIGLPGAEVSLFNEPDLEAGQGILHLVAGPGLGIAVGNTHEIRDLVRDRADVVGIGAAFVAEEPHGQRCCDAELLGDQMREIRHFGDEFSSLRFGPPTN
ncbi:MAG: hypothetical protein M3O70_22040 [Actinomycetota bacterium]|nr:hypothetical protein [Actinomycetota bacterium]